MNPTGPNILLVIVDDMGVHQLGCYGGSFYETPNIDRIAAEGVRFTLAYTASPICSPARAALYTGVHPARWHLTNYIPGTVPDNPVLLTPPWRPYLPVEADTLGDVFKAAGYATGHFGKWHLAHDYQYQPGRPTDPESQGFDDVVVTRKPPENADPEGDPHHMEHLATEAIRFMAKPRTQPFLCVLAHNALHRPELAPEALVKKYADKPGANNDDHRPVLGAMAELMDRSFGRVLEHLRVSGQEKNTVVVFTTDHGAFGRSATRKPLRGAKADLYEGGVRVPLIYRWPGRIVAGERSGPVIGTDLFPTLLEFCGVPIPPALDGQSLKATLENPSRPVPERDEFCWHYPHYHHLGLAPSGAIRAGNWKLIEWFERTIGGATDGPPYELYDLGSDPTESCNLAEREPARCADLARRLREWRRRVGAQEMTPNPAYNPADLARVVPPPPPGDKVNPFAK
jgi:arylsulfatase A